jgi:hypothetical protein
MSPESSPSTSSTDDSVWPYIGVGCLTLIIGFFGGGMIGMMVGKIVDGVTGCRPPEGLPVCTWWRYWWTGALSGAVLLPTVAVYRLRRGRARDDSNTNG